jgi:Integrase zinc binding domain
LVREVRVKERVKFLEQWRKKFLPKARTALNKWIESLEGQSGRMDATALITRNSPVVLPTHLIDLTLNYMHENPLAGHLRFAKTYNRIKERFHFKNIYNIVHEHVRTCGRCQRNKVVTADIPPPGCNMGY